MAMYHPVFELNLILLYLFPALIYLNDKYRYTYICLYFEIPSSKTRKILSNF